MWRARPAGNFYFRDMTGAPYKKNSSSGVWEREGDTRVGFSDGEEAEKHLRSVIGGAKDLSIDSEELPAGIIDWPSEYHLSPGRYNLLRPFDLSSAKRILEIGCG